MRWLSIPAALAALLLLTPARAGAGVAFRDTVSSCPSVIKNVITAEMLLSDGFEPWEAVDGVVDTVDNDVPTRIRSGLLRYARNDDTARIHSGLACDDDTARIRFNDGHCEERSDEAIQNVDTINTAGVIDTINTIDTIVTIVADTVVPVVTDNDKPAPPPPRIKKRMKFGRRAAFNHSQVPDARVRIYSHDGDGFSYAEYPNRAGFGVGFEVAGVIDLVLSEALALNFSPGVVFRKPVNTAVVGTSEVGASFPLLLEWGPFGASGRASPDAFASWPGGIGLRQLRLFGGVWAGAPLFSWVKWNGEESAPFEERAAADFGLMFGVGVYVSDRAFVDARGIFGLSGYDRAGGHRLNQLAIGVNYVK